MWVLYSTKKTHSACLAGAERRNFGQALLSLFQMVTMDAWFRTQHDIARVVSPWLVAVYYIFWILLGAIVFRNVIIGVMSTSCARTSLPLACNVALSGQRETHRPCMDVGCWVTVAWCSQTFRYAVGGAGGAEPSGEGTASADAQEKTARHGAEAVTAQAGPGRGRGSPAGLGGRGGRGQR